MPPPLCLLPRAGSAPAGGYALPPCTFSIQASLGLSPPPCAVGNLWVALGESGAVVCYRQAATGLWGGRNRCAQPCLACRDEPSLLCLPRCSGGTGQELRRVSLPVKRPTACTFGGDQLQHLYVTTRVETGARKVGVSGAGGQVGGPAAAPLRHRACGSRRALPRACQHERSRPCCISCT